MYTKKKEKLEENGNSTKTENKEVPSKMVQNSWDNTFLLSMLWRAGTLVSVISCHKISLNIRQK